jgi:hypothetical protein
MEVRWFYIDRLIEQGIQQGQAHRLGFRTRGDRT